MLRQMNLKLPTTCHVKHSGFKIWIKPSHLNVSYHVAVSYNMNSFAHFITSHSGVNEQLPPIFTSDLIATAMIASVGRRIRALGKPSV